MGETCEQKLKEINMLCRDSFGPLALQRPAP